VRSTLQRVWKNRVLVSDHGARTQERTEKSKKLFGRGEEREGMTPDSVRTWKTQGEVNVGILVPR